MASLPSASIDIIGASGSQGLLAPKESYRAYVFPRGAYASQDSTGTVITLDSTVIAQRFSANNWIQVGLSVANIRQLSAVGGNSIAVSGSAVTVSEGDRIYLIGNTQPTVASGVATYGTPNTLIRQRDDDTADLYTNSMVTSNANGLVQFYAVAALYDVMIQDANRVNQGSITDLIVGIPEGISTSTNAPSIFGSTVTINAALGVTGTATFGSTVMINAALGVTGWAWFGSSVTFQAATGFTGKATFGNSVVIAGALGVTGLGTFSGGLTVASGITVSGTLNLPVGGITTSALAANAVLSIRGASNTSDTAITTAWAQLSGMSIGLIPASSSSVIRVDSLIPFQAYDVGGAGADATVTVALLEFYGPAAIGITIHQNEWTWRDVTGGTQSGSVSLMAIRQGYTQTVSYRTYAMTSAATFGVTLSGTTPRQPLMSLIELKK